MIMKNNLQQIPVKSHSGVRIGCGVMIERQNYWWFYSHQQK